MEFAVIVLPQVAMSMSVAPAEPCFLSLFLLWATLSLKTWRKLFQGSGARLHFQNLLQQLAEPRKRCVWREKTCVGHADYWQCAQLSHLQTNVVFDALS